MVKNKGLVRNNSKRKWKDNSVENIIGRKTKEYDRNQRFQIIKGTWCKWLCKSWKSNDIHEEDLWIYINFSIT